MDFLFFEVRSLSVDWSRVMQSIHDSKRDRRFGVRIPGQATDCHFFKTVQTGSGPTQPFIQRLPELLPDGTAV